ncbi:TPA: lysozyme [Stenotrophomonas maltophilia]
MADTKLTTKQRVGFAAAPLALIGALVAALGTNDAAHEGRRYTPYYDSAGVLTVCAGITGPAVVKGKRYTDDECTRLETTYVRTMLGHMGQCVRGEFEFHEIKAWGHFAYNVGTPAFCGSTAAKRLNAGERQAACTEMWKWRYVAIGGVKRDCALPQWSSKCGGIIDRRQWEMATCQGRLQ